MFNAPLSSLLFLTDFRSRLASSPTRLPKRGPRSFHLRTGGRKPNAQLRLNNSTAIYSIEEKVMNSEHERRGHTV
jgi:hypothetical protein